MTVNVAAGYAEAPTTVLPLLTAQGTAANPIIFQKSGAGANPQITASWTASSTNLDAIVRLSGADYVTFDGIDVADLTTHVTQATAMEAGYALFRASATNGCQHNTVKNCTITMNRSNLTTTVGTGVPFGILGVNSTAAVGTALVITSTSGTNSDNHFYGNTILNTQMGVFLSGYGDTAAPYALLDQNNDVGGATAATGNTIQNFGGVANAVAYGVRMVYQNGGNVSYNLLDNAANGGVASPNTFYGVQFDVGTNASGTASHNTITIAQAENNNQVEAVQMNLAGTGTTTVNDNTVNYSLTATSGTANTSTRLLLLNSAAAGALNMNGNTVNITLAIAATGGDMSGVAYGLDNAGAVTGPVSMSNNVVHFVLSNSGSSRLSSGCQGLTNAASVTGNVVMNNNAVAYSLANTGSTGVISSSCYGVTNGAAVGGNLTMSGNTVNHTVPAGAATGGFLNSFMIGVFEYGNVQGDLTLDSNSCTYSIANDGAAIGSAGNTLLGVHTQSVVTVGGATSLSGNTVGYTLATSAGATTAFMRAVNNSAALTGPATISNNVVTYTGTSTGGTFSSGFVAVSNLGPTSAALTLDGNTLLNSSTSSTGDITFVNATGTSTALVTVSNNRYQNSSTASVGPVVFISNSNATNLATGSNLLVQGNTFTGLTRTGGGGTTGYLNIGFATAAGTHTIRNNTISGLTLLGSFVGIEALATATGSGTSIITYDVRDNVVGTLASGGGISSTGASPVVGLWAGGTAVSGTLANNSVQNLSSAGQAVGLTLSGSTGVPISTTNSFFAGTISGNTITTLSTTSSAAVYGMYLPASNAPGGSISTTANTVANLSTSSTGQVYGIYVASGPSHTLANNVVVNLTSPAGTGTPAVAGLSLGGGTVLNAYYNTVYLSGTGPNSSAACYRANTTATTLRNNIFYNARTGSGSNYALTTTSATGFVGSTTNPSTNTADYNLLITADATKVGLYGATPYSFAGWKTATGGDGSSLSETTATVPAASLFTSPATGDFSLNAANPSAWYANGTGTQLAGVATDYAGAARSTTVAAGAPDLGALEVTPASTPPALTAAPAAPAPGATQTFSLGGRTLASLTYGSTGTVPTSVVARYYSGTNPPAPFLAGARYANAYFDFSAVGGSGYTYQPTLAYDPALLGTIASEAAQRISQRTADNSGYGTFFATAVSPAPVRTLAGPSSLTRFGILAISDQAAPLPVELVRFEATRQGADALLTWGTAAERDNQGFEVQVSPDGQHFRALGFVAGAGTSATARSYRFLDREAGKTGPRYYRLRQLDRQGPASFSPVQTVLFDAPTLQLLAWPNPCQQAPRLSLVLPQATAATLTLTDALGRPVWRQELGALPAGPSQPVLDAAAFGRLPAGVYALRLTTSAGIQTLQLVKE
ncbi:T9SS type A sorting domain-containing protein [Hymenobacter sp. 5317J-9]|uniref:T9SS type A sorting domain-containing protein n=1 Tax=Hymenobacter sp. 5317J-9 TaxID=2932250 RepID=UPI001FD6EDA1|nr:T9SS type A sorting domain-containing protein [Hymenobacter sp. 5317J-9]UOQ98411.1 T9SS type A sorting domain-containing protein [Hymenobacter sp. 5317J-9]